MNDLCQKELEMLSVFALTFRRTIKPGFHMSGKSQTIGDFTF